MIGLDTNVLVRYVAQDDPKQSAKATKVIESLSVEIPGRVCVVTIVEFVWVMTECYSATKSELCEVLETLLRTKEIVVEQADVVWKALRMFKEGNADFADCLIERANKDAGCAYTLTFDRGAAKHCSMQLIN